MKNFFLFAILFISCNLFGCHSPNSNEPDIHGYVLDRYDDTIFVVSKFGRDYSDTGGVHDFFDAIILDNAPQNVDVGHEVRIWYKGDIENSYPSRGTIGTLEIMKSKQTVGAANEQNEMIRRAIEQIETNDFIEIIGVQYNKQEKNWAVTYKQIKYFEEEPTTYETIYLND